MDRTKFRAPHIVFGALLGATAAGSAALAAAAPFAGDQDQGAYEPPRAYVVPGPPPPYANANVSPWAIGTFYGRNSANGVEETITIRPDGSVELRTRDQAPAYGTFAGETLTLGRRMSKVQAARGGIVIDGMYYRR